MYYTINLKYFKREAEELKPENEYDYFIIK